MLYLPPYNVTTTTTTTATNFGANFTEWLATNTVSNAQEASRSPREGNSEHWYRHRGFRINRG